MRRLVTVLVLTLVIFVLVVPVQAYEGKAIRAQQVEFLVEGQTTNPGQPTFIPAPPPAARQALIRGMVSEGSVTGSFNGPFRYVEDILASYPRQAFINKASMTITAPEGDIRIEFGGVGELVFGADPWTPIGVVVQNQPWVITGGSGAYKDLRGGGTRSTLPRDQCPSEFEFCTKFKGKTWFR